MDRNSTGLLFVGLLLSGLFLLVAAGAWLKVSGATGDAPRFLKRAAALSAVALGALGLTALLGAFLL